MRRLAVLVVLCGAALCNTGCFIPIYSSDPNRRMQQMLNTSEDLRVIEDEWSRIWFTDHPSHLTFDRIDGSLE
jgi:hypothetical protein